MWPAAGWNPGIGMVLPSLYLPIRGPRISAPARAAQPPTECTTVEPAKVEEALLRRRSRRPISTTACDRVDDACQDRDKIRKGHSLMRSASAAGHDGGRCRTEHQLEEEVRTGGGITHSRLHLQPDANGLKDAGAKSRGTPSVPIDQLPSGYIRL